MSGDPTPGARQDFAHLVDLEDHPQAENFVRQGVTTILASLFRRSSPCEPGRSRPLPRSPRRWS